MVNSTNSTTNNPGREYLKQAFKARRRIELLREQIARIREEMTLVGGGFSEHERVQESRERDPLGSMVARKLDKIDECKAEICEWDLLLMNIEDVISRACGDKSQTVLVSRYIKQKSFSEIADEMLLGLRQIERYHSQGVREVMLAVGDNYTTPSNLPNPTNAPSH
ncbi:MAG: hypothetical protein FWG87_13930 [Defluviitaleaceae bacterium]|nr:hypothetical protein [Defluviitaleaceae bacterium]